MMDVGCWALTYGGAPTAIVQATRTTANHRLQLPVIVIKNLPGETDSAGLTRPSKDLMAMVGEHQRPRSPYTHPLNVRLPSTASDTPGRVLPASLCGPCSR